MRYLTIQDFAGTANEEFSLAVGEAAMAVTLVEVKPLAARPHPMMHREPFSLLFKSASPVILPQKSYRVSHPSVGAHDIFLVPIARDVQGIVYQAVFN